MIQKERVGVFPKSLPEFQRMFPDENACLAYLEKARWSDVFICPHCKTMGEPFRFSNRPRILRCRRCRRDTSIVAGTIMKDTRMPLSVWFWAAFLVSSHTPGGSVKMFL